MPNKVIIETHAYNASATMERTIQSVLAQTHTNWEWHLYENASTDGGKTNEIICKYATMDTRIKAYQHINNIPLNTYLFLAAQANLTDNADNYFTYICADDTWEPEYLSHLITFQQENNLDIATCISTHIDAYSGEILNKFFLQENVFVSTPQEYSDRFPTIYSFYRDFWAHLIPFSTLARLNHFDYLNAFAIIPYSFLALSLNLLAKTERIGILAEPLHNYYLSKTGHAYAPKLRISRINHFASLGIKLRTFLLSKCGYVSTDNERFIQGRYVKTITDYLPTIFATNDEVAKLLFILNIVRQESTTTAFESDFVSAEAKAAFCNQISTWLNDSMVNKRFDLERHVGETGGMFEYHASYGQTTLNYPVYDLYALRTNRLYSNEYSSTDFAQGLLRYILELEQFLVKYRTI